MIRHRSLVSLLAATVFLACAQVAGADARAPAAPPPVTPAKLEPVTVAKITQARGASPTSTLKLNVASGGCTQAADFRLVVTQRTNDQALRVERLKQDLCEAFAPQGATVELTTTALVPNKPITVENPLFVGIAY